jgi:hypothetical protein
MPRRTCREVWSERGKQHKEPTMKITKLLTLCAALVCAATLVTGCACCGKSKSAAACGMQCCTDSGATCATCPTCSKK